jgi:diadenosine tetraphosphate (Ap4A) HIT family hydrolase
MSIEQQILAARAGVEPALISRVSSGWVILAHTQFLRGYSILMPDPVVPSLNALDPDKRSSYLCDMALVGDALMEVTGAFRINYAIFGNSDPALHAHIVPRFLFEPDEIRKGPPWTYSQEIIDRMVFNPEQDQSLILQLRTAIQKRL